MRCSTFAAVFLTPLYVLAEVAFTNDAYDGITAGAPFTITWSGDGTVRLIHVNGLILTADPASTSQ